MCWFFGIDMVLYTYKGYDAQTGAAKKGTIDADTPRAARARLRQRDKIIISELKEAVTDTKKSPRHCSPSASVCSTYPS